MNRPGRPRVDPTECTAKVSVSLPARDYDALYRQARDAKVTVPELIRRSLRPILGSVKSTEPEPTR